MDKMKGLAKGGWHPAGDKQIKRETWKSDLKGIATGKKKDPFEEQKSHTSTPLSSLRDPDSFGPPPKHSDYYSSNGQPISRAGTGGSATVKGAELSGPTSGWGGPVVETGYAQRKRKEEEEEERRRTEAAEAAQKKESGPWRVDASGLRTDNLPKPPVRRNGTPESGETGRSGLPSLPPRQQVRDTPSPIAPVPSRQPPPQANAGPPPILPPRQNEYPDENTPAPPPPYNEALQQPRNPSQIAQGASQRLAQAGVSVPAFEIGSNNNPPESPATRGPPQGQLSELQQRFARMNAGGANELSLPATPISSVAAHKKPPPPPPKKAALSTAANSGENASFTTGPSQAPAPPPIPMGSKPRPS